MEFPKSPLNEIKRGKKKATYDQEAIYAILDAVEVCHVAFLYEGRPMVQPINFGRLNDKIYLHGSVQNRMTSALIETGEACLNVMLLDGMKLTRSAFNHSVNYRSATVFGMVRNLESHEEKLIGLEAIINHFVPNRWENCRPPNEKELNATRVVEIQITSGSAKIADTPSTDKESDLNLNYWAGILPVRQIIGKPAPAVDLDSNVRVPQHVVEFINNRNN